MTDTANKGNPVEVFLNLNVQHTVTRITPDGIFRNFLPHPHIVIEIDFIHFEDLFKEFSIVVIDRGEQLCFWYSSIHFYLVKIEVNTIIESEIGSISYHSFFFLSVQRKKR